MFSQQNIPESCHYSTVQTEVRENNRQDRKQYQFLSILVYSKQQNFTMNRELKVRDVTKDNSTSVLSQKDVMLSQKNRNREKCL